MALQISKKKQVLFATIIVLASLFSTLIPSELILRFRRQSIEKSEHFDPGLIKYDRYLGWELTPNWKGRHKHHDFDVMYSTNQYGFRGNFGEKDELRRYAVVGDSFTFSYGVNDNETFVHLLNSEKSEGNIFLNFGVPGYSTDQEYLIIKERVFYFSPDVILLVVYLANDLFDNELPFPLQANHAKPYFELTSNGLTLKNTPVPLINKPKAQGQKDLTKVVLGDEFPSNNAMERYLGRFELFRLLKLNFYKTPDLSHRFRERFKQPLQLFKSIIEQIREECIRRKIELHLVLMPGKSFIDRPGSPSEQYQDYLRKKIFEMGEKIGLDVIDLAILLKRRYQKHPGRWFHPHEGHLTPEGHRVVAEILASEFH